MLAHDVLDQTNPCGDGNKSILLCPALPSVSQILQVLCCKPDCQGRIQIWFRFLFGQDDWGWFEGNFMAVQAVVLNHPVRLEHLKKKEICLHAKHKA